MMSVRQRLFLLAGCTIGLAAAVQAEPPAEPTAASVPASAPASYTSPDHAFQMVPPAGWKPASRQRLRDMTLSEQAIGFQPPQTDDARTGIWIRWRRLPWFPPAYEETSQGFTVADQRRIHDRVAGQGMIIVSEQPGWVGSCPAYGLMSQTRGQVVLSVMTTLFVCRDVEMVFDVIGSAATAQTLAPAAQAALNTFQFLSSDRVPYVVPQAEFQIVPPPNWKIVDRRTTAPPNNQGIEFHAATGSASLEEMAQYRFPYLRVQWTGEGVIPMTGQQLKQLMQLDLHDQAKLVKESETRIGRYDGYEWIVEEASGSQRSKWISTTFVANGRVFTARYQAGSNNYDRLHAAADKSLHSFKILK